MNEKNNEPSDKSTKKSNIIISILKFIAKSVLAILLILSIFYQLPWKIITFLAIIFTASTILPYKYRKRFWVAVLSLYLTLLIWKFVPEDNSKWYPYTFENEIAELESKYKIPDEENAAFKYYEIFETLNFDVNQPEYFLSSEPCSHDEFWLAEDHPETAEWIKGNQEIIESVITASKLPKCIIPPNFYKNRFNFTNDLANIRHCVFLLISSANNDIAEGQIEEALEKYQTCFRIANQIHQFPSFTHVLVSWAIKEKTIIPLIKIIVEEKFNPEQLEQIRNLIDDMRINWSSDWVDMLDIDMIIAKNYFAGTTFETNGMGKLRYSRRPFEEDTESLQEQVEYTYQSGIIGKLRAISRWICYPPSIKAINKILIECVEDHYNMAQSDYDWDRDVNYDTPIKFNYKFVIKSMIQENNETYKRIHTVYLKDTTLLRGSKILIALRQYKNEHATWPDSLDVIKSYVPAEAFIDPATGKQLQYEKSGEEFTLSGELISIWPFDNLN